MRLDRVTITGADDSIAPKALLGLSEDYPFVEWGILVSKTQEGGPRFPTRLWIRELVESAPADMKLSLHVCGRWVRRLMVGDDELLRDVGYEAPSLTRFQRVQLNFHAERHDVLVGEAAALFLRTMPRQQIIVQMDGTANEDLLGMLCARGVAAVPLFDTSGGAGVVPGEWPRPFPGIEYHGYAGGLGPDTLTRELPRIAEAAVFPSPGENPELSRGTDARIWIDMERRVRSADDQQFDLARVRRCLEICAPLVIP